ncbi:MAG: polynucleotide phosphatase/kinase [Hyperionvirus sp.]|uniref:Polynucleotide phosphatase/kinase n=1 Tax=Hyperionvirus sp. TaxID=2487770 RepID=A0A3G5ACG4_9VIRU|nr:MAG: polynucleotide phosphatase/kinase [Hyperionvirus sp.]
MNWEINDLLSSTTITPKFTFTPRCACFDLDSTLIKTKSGKKFPKDENDWIFFSPNVLPKLKELHKADYCIIIITNQSGLSNETKRIVWKKKVDEIVKQIALPIKLFCSIAHDIYRKPLPAITTKHIQPNISIDFTRSFYCGDACGRPGDHSDCDYKFALNSNLNFKLPEELFDNNITALPKIIYQPFIEIQQKPINPPFTPNINEIILMIGPPGSGKSKYATEILVPLNYVRINRDTLKTPAKCLKEAKKAIDEHKNVVIDNTNYDIKNRLPYIKLAQSHNYTVRCIIMETSHALSSHNATYRFYKGIAPIIPEIAYRIYKKNYSEPTLDEGITEIIKISPPNTNTDPIYKLYLT